MSISDPKENSNSSVHRATQAEDPVSFFQVEEDKELLQNVVFETLHTESYSLSYACLIIPRFPAHQLKGDLVEYLPQWLSHVCMAYNWRLGFLEVMPGYLHFVLFVSSSTSPKHFMQVIRSEVSNMIFSNFGRLQRECLGQDFWAPGHLLAVGSRPHSEDWIENFIRSTRRQQGLVTL